MRPFTQALTLSLLLLVVLRGVTSGDEADPRVRFWCRARHAQFGYDFGVSAKSRRSKAAAERRAQDFLATAQAEPERFAELARACSEAQDSNKGGLFTPAFRFDQVELGFARLAFSAQLGDVVGPIETPAGFHVLRRESVSEWSGQQLLVTWSGAKRAPLSITRGRDEARSRAHSLLLRARAGEDLDALAKLHSDATDAKHGGHFGVVTRALVSAPIATALERLEPGELCSSLVETPFGFHILRRVRTRLLWARHILLEHRASFQSQGTRSLEDARQTARRLLRELKAGAPFERLAATHSATRRYVLGPVPATGAQLEATIQRRAHERTRNAPSFDIAESPYGIHVLSFEPWPSAPGVRRGPRR